MHRESIFVCTYTAGDGELVAHVCAWDDREAAELFAREMELESHAPAISIADIRVRPAQAVGHARAAASGL